METKGPAAGAMSEEKEGRHLLQHHGPPPQLDSSAALKTADIFAADASFASGWGVELCSNPDSVKSRTGFIVEIANCPVI